MTTNASTFGALSLTQSENVWNRLVRSVEGVGAAIGPYSQAIVLLNSRGKLTPGIAKAYVAWVDSANKVLSHLADLIQGNQALRDTIDAVSTGTSVTGLSADLSAYLGAIVRPSDEVIELLRGQLPAVTPKALSGLGVTAAQGQALARFTGPAWKKLMELLSNRGVATVGSVAVAGHYASDLIGSDIDLEEQRSALYLKIRDGLIATGMNPDEADLQARRVLAQTKTGDFPILWFAGGAVGLGLLLFWAKQRGVTVVVPERGGRS